MERIKNFWKRLVSYGWGAHLFIFVSPVYRWNDVILTFMDMDWQTGARYVVDVVIGWVLVEIITQARENKPKKRTYRTKKPKNG